MRYRRCHHQRGGFVGIEFLVALVIMGLVAALLTDALISHHRTRDRYVHRQAALRAAAGQLQRYQAGAPLDSMPPEGIVAQDIRLQTRAEPGQGEWSGFTRVTVIATTSLPRGDTLREEVTGYIAEEARP